MLKGFKQFILRGNVVDLATAVVVGAAFTAIVQALVKDFITPLIGAFWKQKALSESYFTFHGSDFYYGDFLNALLNFLIVSGIIYFFVIVPINKLLALHRSKETTPEPTTKKCPYCLSEVPKAASICAFCTSSLPHENTAGKTNAGSKQKAIGRTP